MIRGEGIGEGDISIREVISFFLTFYRYDIIEETVDFKVPPAVELFN
jgi:hypothetical protein